MSSGFDGTKSFIDVDKATLLADSVDREDSFLAKKNDFWTRPPSTSMLKD